MKLMCTLWKLLYTVFLHTHEVAVRVSIRSGYLSVIPDFCGLADVSISGLLPNVRYTRHFFTQGVHTYLCRDGSFALVPV